MSVRRRAALVAGATAALLSLPAAPAAAQNYDEPPRELRVVINDGARYTNDPDVVVSVSDNTNPFPKVFQFSNDGGFRPGVRIDERQDGRYPWRLQSTGPEALPKTVYVRSGTPFSRTVYGASTWDEIVLDQTAPRVLGTSSTKGRPRQAATGGSRRARAIRIRARDRTSGVAAVQFARRRKQPRSWADYSSTRSYGVKSARYVRVRDGAGNRSRWRSLRPTARGRKP